jgi:hypothetical protein
MKEKFIKTIVDVTTGETEIVEMTDIEIAKVLEAREIVTTKRAEEKNEAEAKATARQTILDRLGLSAEEASILLG